MSEFINNREMRKNELKNIIKQLHDGKSVDEVKDQFSKSFGEVSATEIAELERALVKDGMDVSEIQKLCDVHAAVFKGSVAEIHKQDKAKPADIPGHPVNTLIRENRILEEIIEKEIEASFNKEDIEDITKNLKNALDKLSKIDIHYKRKENVIFPYMEKHDMETPSKVMWGVDDEIREMINFARISLAKPLSKEDLMKLTTMVVGRVKEMIFKEENIMIPMLLEKLSEDEWKAIYDESDEIGYLLDEVAKWEPKKATSNIDSKKEDVIEEGYVKLPSGHFKIEELTWMLNTLPFDVTFVDKNNEVKYFSEGKERTFPRTRAIIGRNVSNCHPPASVHIVEKIVEDLRSGKKDNEDFWIKMRDKFVLIRYFAVRNEKGEYLGVLEVTQDIKGIQELTGEKRLVSE